MHIQSQQIAEINCGYGTHGYGTHGFETHGCGYPWVPIGWVRDFACGCGWPMGARCTPTSISAARHCVPNLIVFKLYPIYSDTPEVMH